MTMTDTHQRFATLLDKLGEVAVKAGLNLRPGQELIISAPIEALPLVRTITKYAYQVGTTQVTPIFSDNILKKARFLYGHEAIFDYASQWFADGIAEAFQNGAARMAITGEDPSLLSDIAPERIARATKASSIANQKAMKLITSFATNWTIVAFATPEWAAKVFPDIPIDQAVENLWEAIFTASRIRGTDPIAEWKDHNAQLNKKATQLNTQRFSALHFTGPGTDMTIGLADDHFWAAGAEETQNGIICNPNIPTEEVFTTPHRLRVNGHVQSTKPLSYQGNLIDNIRVTFKDGTITEAHATKGEDALHRMIANDEGARRLGEVALVPHSSPIAQQNILFQNTLFDENAASHIALGQSYSKCMMNAEALSDKELLEKGANQSIIHVDWMIGSGEIDVDGLSQTQERQPLMRKGEWV
ncbi:aminopeptidase [Entomobacter blattae]|nr:aminopeptidase [Entomobacter blattae]